MSDSPFGLHVLSAMVLGELRSGVSLFSYYSLWDPGLVKNGDVTSALCNYSYNRKPVLLDVQTKASITGPEYCIMPNEIREKKGKSCEHLAENMPPGRRSLTADTGNPPKMLGSDCFACYRASLCQQEHAEGNSVPKITERSMRTTG